MHPATKEITTNHLPQSAIGQRSSSLSQQNRIRSVLACYLAIWATAPVLAYGSSYRLAAVLAVAMWFTMDVFRNNGVIRRPGYLVLLSFAYVLYTAIISTEFDSSDDIVRQLSTYICILFLLLYIGVKRIDLSILKLSFWAVLWTYPVWITATLIAIQVDPRITRRLIRSSEEAIQATGSGIGGYALVYSLVFLIPMLVFLLIESRLWRATNIRWNKTKSVLILANIALGTALVFKAGYTIAVALLVLGLILVLLPRRSGRFAIFAAGAVVLGLYFSLANWSDIKSGVLSASNSTAYATKVDDIYRSVEADETIGTVDQRVERYARSVSIFLEYPAIGSMSRTTVGKHSPILDHLAQYGLIVGLVFSYIFLKVPMRFLNRDVRLLPLSRAIFVLAVLFAFLNNHFPAYGVVVFLMYPVVRAYAAEWRKT